MDYSIIKIWETFVMDSGYMYYLKNAGYYLTEDEARKAAGVYLEVQSREAIKIGNEIFLLAGGVGYNKPIQLGANNV